MDIRWLEDFIAVAEKGHFAHAAEARNMTQSALSRRIKAVEQWAGAELLDRSSHPIIPTEAGEEFTVGARDIVSRTLELRGVVREIAGNNEQDITIASMHTLSLYFMPELVEMLRQKETGLSVNIVAETRTLSEYLNALSGGTSDLFICYDHPAITPAIDHKIFERLSIVNHQFALYSAVDKAPCYGNPESNDDIPYLAFSGSSIMAHVADNITNDQAISDRLNIIYRASLAESLFAACQRGLGIAWLPDAIFPDTAEAAGMQVVFPEMAQPLHVCAYRARSSKPRPLVDRVWHELGRIGQG